MLRQAQHDKFSASPQRRLRACHPEPVFGLVTLSLSSCPSAQARSLSPSACRIGLVTLSLSKGHAMLRQAQHDKFRSAQRCFGKLSMTSFGRTRRCFDKLSMTKFRSDSAMLRQAQHDKFSVVGRAMLRQAQHDKMLRQVSMTNFKLSMTSFGRGSAMLRQAQHDKFRSDSAMLRQAQHDKFRSWSRDASTAQHDKFQLSMTSFPPMTTPPRTNSPALLP